MAFVVMLKWPEPTPRSTMLGGAPSDYVATVLCGGYCLRVHKIERWSTYVTWGVWDANGKLCGDGEAASFVEAQRAAETAVTPLLRAALAALEGAQA